MTQISHDGFARQMIERATVSGNSCDWCGQPRRRNGVALTTLFEYATVPEDSGRRNAHKGHFCSKGCHDDYHS